MNKKLKTLFIILTSPVALWAQTQSFSLEQAEQFGLENNTSVKSAALDVKGGEATVGERLSVGLPQLSGSLDYQYFVKLPTSLIPAEFFGGEPGTFIPVQFGTKQNVTAGLSFSQIIFNGSWLVGVNAAKTYVGLLENQQKLSEQEVKKNIELSYYTVLVSKETEKILQKNIDNLSKTTYEVTQMNKQGFVEQIDVDRLQISLSNLQTQLANVTRQTELAKIALKFQMGMDSNTPIELTDSIQGLKNDFIVLDNDQHYLNRPEFAILETTKLLNDYNVKVNKAGYLPSLMFIASLQENAQRDDFSFFDTNQQWFQTTLVGVTLNVPIFDGLQKKYAIENAKVGLDKAELTQQNATQGILLEIAKAKTDYLNAKNDLENQTANIGLAQRIYDVTLVKYREGVGSSLELTSAESSLYQSQAAYIGALFNVLSAKSNLTKALGY